MRQRMPMQKLIVDGRECKIRRRGCSSSSSSSLARNYRLKRAVLIGKKGGSSTPVPTWKVGSISPPLALQNAKLTKKNPPCNDAAVSARKLAATLWEINEDASIEENWEGKNEMEVRRREIIDKASRSGCSALERMDRSKNGVRERRLSVVPQFGGLNCLHNASIIKIETLSDAQTSGYVIGVKTRLKAVSNGLTASKELLKVLRRIWLREEQHLSSVSLVSALQFELDRARKQVDQLIQEQRSNRNEIDYLLKQFAEEKAAWKNKERERISSAISFIAGEFEVERKLRRQTKRLNKKLGRELADAKASLSEALKELHSEKRAREILNQTCDELARGVGEERAEVEEMKKESAKVREEVEKERKMLQLADVLREERVQMKLSEAKYEFEKKNAAVDKLKSELEAYLRTKIGEEKADGSPNFDKIKELEEYLRKTLGASCLENVKKEPDEGKALNQEYRVGEDSADCDLHSIELNMDNNSKSYNWSYARGGATQNDLKRSSVEEKLKGTRSIDEKIQRNGMCSERNNSDGIGWEFCNKNQENSDGFDRGRFLERASQAWRTDNEDEMERYEMLRDLKDHILSGTSILSSQSFANPNQHII